MAVVILVSTILATVMGVAGGLWGGPKSGVGDAGSARTDDHKAKAAQPARALRELKPIVTNLAQPPGAWIRLELALVVASAIQPAAEPKLIEFASDTTDFLRTATAQQIEGPNGLRRLREDLLDRARFRLGADAEAVLIQTLVIQ